jgi:hypothetical protein
MDFRGELLVYCEYHINYWCNYLCGHKVDHIQILRSLSLRRGCRAMLAMTWGYKTGPLYYNDAHFKTSLNK